MQSDAPVPPQTERVILKRETRPSERPKVSLDASNLHRPVLWSGGAITLASLATYVMLWWAPRLGNPQWEFSTISQTLEMMPLLVVGVTMLVVATIASGSARGARLLAGVCAALVLVLVAMAVLFLMASLVAYSQASQSGMPGEAKGLLLRAVGKHVFMGGIYTFLFGTLSWSLWSRVKRGRNAAVVSRA